MIDDISQWIDTLQYAHHRQSVINLRDEFIQDESIQALVLGGSICHGYGRKDSDIDCMMLIDAQACEQRRKSNAVCYYATHLTPYEGGYVDGKYQSLEYLQMVAERGPEPARYAYKDAKIIFSRIPGLPALLQRVSAYPEAERENRIVRFHAQLDGMRWFFGEGIKRDDRFTAQWAAVNMILFGSRMLLAYNRVLFPCQKTMTHELRRCTELPQGIFGRMDELLANPVESSAEAYYRAIKQWRQWEQAGVGWADQFMADAELKWLTGTPYVGEI
jgi:hypothetical protein